jgi:formamidopyrimidine-DNA glycosylase
VPYYEFMPELPEVETVVRELNRKLKKKKVKDVEVFLHKLVHVGPKTVSNVRTNSVVRSREFIRQLQGQVVERVVRRGKMLQFFISNDLVMLVHLKMTGQFIFEDTQLRAKTNGLYKLLNKESAPHVPLPSKHTHVVFHFTDKSTLYFNDVRQFGYLRILDISDLSLVKDLAQYGPEPFDKAFTLEVFSANLTKRSRTTIKLALLDPKVVVGIGNIYSDEILFHAGVLPTRLVGSLTSEELRNIYHEIRPVLRKGIETRGSSVGDFVRTDGSWGSMGKHHFVYGRRKQSCKICGTLIQSTKLGGRTASYCPYCQK